MVLLHLSGYFLFSNLLIFLPSHQICFLPWIQRLMFPMWISWWKYLWNKCGRCWCCTTRSGIFSFFHEQNISMRCWLLSSSLFQLCFFWRQRLKSKSAYSRKLYVLIKLTCTKHSELSINNYLAGIPAIASTTIGLPPAKGLSPVQLWITGSHECPLTFLNPFAIQSVKLAL